MMTPKGHTYHLIGRIETCVRYFHNGMLLMRCFFAANYWRIRGQGEVNARIRDQIGLELGQVNIQGAIET